MEEELDLFGWVGGTVDGKYRVDAVVGSGGFGIVYRAHHLGFDQTVALKCLRLPKTLAGTERERFRETFLAEGRLLHQLSRATTGIVQALDLGAAVSPNKHWTPYLVLEWLDGVPLDRDFSERRKAAQGGRSFQDALGLLGSAARALALAHAQGVAHRDIKPANLFLTTLAGQTVLKVLDFGIAKVMAESESVTRAFEETGASLQAFTARYGAPEQFSRRYGATGPWTDVFSLALVFIEAVSGRHALGGTDAAQLFVAAADPERRPTLRALGAPSSDAVEAVLLRALAIDPRERYPNAGEFWSALELAGREGARTPSASSLAATEAAPAPPGLVPIGPEAKTSADLQGNPKTELNSSTHLPSTRAETRHAQRRGTRLLVALGAAALTVGALGTVLVRSALEHPIPLERLHPRSASGALVEPAAKSPVPAPERTQAKAASSTSSPAPAAKQNIEPRGSLPLSGVPERNIPAGIVGQTFIGAFRVLAREQSFGLNFENAAKQCSDVGLALCTDTQWQQACSSVPELARVQSWTASVDDTGVSLRGGDKCETSSLAPPTDATPSRYALCCERAIAMTTGNLQKQYLATTAERVLLVERALNQRDVGALLALAEPTVIVDDETKTLPQLRTLLEKDFRMAPDLVVITDVCDVAVQAKKVTRRIKKRTRVAYETQGWTADCKQSALLAGQVTYRQVFYSFNAASKLREIKTRSPE